MFNLVSDLSEFELKPYFGWPKKTSKYHNTFIMIICTLFSNVPCVSSHSKMLKKKKCRKLWLRLLYFHLVSIRCFLCVWFYWEQNSKHLFKIICTLFSLFLECEPSGAPNGQWMKIPRPGKQRLIIEYWCNVFMFLQRFVKIISKTRVILIEFTCFLVFGKCRMSFF